MTTPEIVMWAAVLAVGLTARFNWTAGALSIAWLFGEAVYRITGDGLAVQYYLYPDIFVLGVIFAKPERSITDWAIVAIYPAAWVFYIANIDAASKWWALYYIMLAQLLIAGAGSLYAFYRRHADAASPKPDHPGTLLVAYPGGGRFG